MKTTFIFTQFVNLFQLDSLISHVERGGSEVTPTETIYVYSTTTCAACMTFTSNFVDKFSSRNYHFQSTKQNSKVFYLSIVCMKNIGLRKKKCRILSIDGDT